jgi:HK97 family phage prohead protease
MDTTHQRHEPTTFAGRISNIEVRESGAGAGQRTVSGHAAVFNQLADLGYFREKIEPGAFANILSRDPDVHLVVAHDWSKALARTRNKTLKLREDEEGLAFWARVADVSYADDLATLMERGDVDQCSFRFTIERETAEIDDEGVVTFTIHEIGELLEVSICPQGAYPQTDAELVASRMRDAGLELQARHLPADTARAPEGPPHDIDVDEGGSAVTETGGETRRSLVIADARLRMARARTMTP